MTLNYKKLSRKTRLFKTFTGFNQDEFDRIFKKINEGYETYEKERLNRKDRKRAIGAGRKFKLQLRERFLMLLVYYRLYITYTLAGFLFDVDQSTIYRNIRHLEALVKECIPLPEKIQERVERIRDVDELFEILPEMEAFVDATEQEIPRPKDKQKNKEYYSGKKKRHTIKTQIATNKDGLIVHRSKSVEGKKHDYTLFKEQPPPIPEDIESYVDMGYLGIEKDFPEMNVRIPHKKPKGGELSEAQKEYNRNLRKKRVIVEHSICRMKKYEIFGSKFRNRYERYDTMTSIVGGFVNFRIMNFCASIPTK